MCSSSSLSPPCCHLQFRTEENFQFQAAEMISSNIETVFADRGCTPRLRCNRGDRGYFVSRENFPLMAQKRQLHLQSSDYRCVMAPLKCARVPVRGDQARYDHHITWPRTQAVGWSLVRWGDLHPDHPSLTCHMNVNTISVEDRRLL